MITQVLFSLLFAVFLLVIAAILIAYDVGRGHINSSSKGNVPYTGNSDSAEKASIGFNAPPIKTDTITKC